MNKKEILDGMSIRELQDVIYEKEKEEAIKKYGKKETEFKMSEIEELEAEYGNPLYHVVLEDGSEGWEVLVEVDDDIEYNGDLEELVKNHIINFVIENDYYQSADIEDIRVSEICRYSRPIFKIYDREETEET
jgi:hypothetical protein